MLLLARVCEIVEIHALGVAVDPCCHQPETIEAGADLLMSVAKIENCSFAAHFYRNAAAAVGSSGIVVKRPLMRLAIRHDPRPIISAGMTLSVAADTIGGVDEESLSARPLDCDADKALREAGS